MFVNWRWEIPVPTTIPKVMERMAATMGCGIAARIPPNLPALNENNIIRKTLKVLSTQTKCFLSTIASVKQDILQKTLTKYGEEKHEKGRNLDHSSASNTCESNKANIFTGRRKMEFLLDTTDPKQNHWIK
jgi:hypothetical protein